MQSIEELKDQVYHLQKEVEKLNTQIKTGDYGISWIDVPEAFDKESENKIPILKEVHEKAVVTDNKKTTHIFIEGDNYHALHCLNYTHHGDIDIIYIDPPYNTGKDGFTYKDARFLESYPDGSTLPANHPLRHSCWLSFMWKRLSLAYELLSDDGIIFLSIGDDEQANLKMLCDKVFGEENFIETYIWNSIARPDNSSPLLRRNAEFVLCYAKNKSNILAFNGVVSDTSGMPSLTKSKEKISTIEFPAYSVHTTLPDGTYKAGLKDNGSNPQWELVEDVVVKNGFFITPLKLSGHTYWTTKKKIESELNSGTEIWIKTEAFVPYYKKAKDSINRPTKILPAEFVKEGIYANNELLDIFGTKVFSNPKPSTLIGFLINFLDKKDGKVLDFFAGSGTTLQGVMNLNEADGGTRQCILVQMADTTFEVKDGVNVPKKGYEGPFNAGYKTVADIAYERGKRLINGYISHTVQKDVLYRKVINLRSLKKGQDILSEAEDIKQQATGNYSSVKIALEGNELVVYGENKKNTAIPGIKDNLKYYRADFVGKHQPREATDEDKEILAREAGCLLALAQNTLYEIAITHYYQFFTDNKGHTTAIYFQENYSKFEEFRDKVHEFKGNVTVYIFSWSNAEEFQQEFDDMKTVEIKPIPQPTLDIYRSINV